MEKIIKRKILAIGILILFLGASATLGASAAFTNGQTPRVMRQTIQAINQPIVGQTGIMGNVKISDNAGNDFHPHVTTTAHDQIVVVYEQEMDIFSKQVPVTFSADAGATWTQAYLFDSVDFTSGSGVLQYPSILYNAPNDLLYLNMIDPQADMYNNEMAFIPGNIASGGDASWYGISGTGSTNYVWAACACTSNFFYSVQTYDGNDPQIFGLGIFTYPDFAYPPGVGGFYYDAESLHVSHPSTQVEMSSNANHLFLVSESGVDGGPKITIKTNVADETLITSGEQQNGMDKYADIEQWVGSYIDVGKDPDVSGSGSKVAVAYQSATGDIKCAVSSSAAGYDPAFSWSITTVDTGGSSPAVYMQGNNVYCAYVKGGNLYMKTSSDGGATWGAADKKNDVDGKVVGDPGSVDLANGACVWVDNRNGNEDIYFAAGGGGATANVVVDSISGGMGVSAVLKNTGKADATNFAWSIKTDGTVFVGKEKSGTATLAAGASTTVKTGLMLGIGAITITVTADTATKTATAKLLLFLVTGLK